MKKILKSGAACLLFGSRLLRFSLGPVTGGGGRFALASTHHAPLPQSEETSAHAASVWLENCLKEQPSLPIFAVQGKNLTVLREPREFYQTLKSKAANANKRIVLASLYLGTGNLEQELVNTLHQRSRELADQSVDFEVQVLLEHTRGSRGTKNSRTMLLPLLQDFPDNVKVALYHTPKLRGLLRAIVPERFNETVSAMHLKVYIFDDTLVMSGANLSNDYFTNRQDRCIVFEDCKELCDYFHDLVNTVSSFSLRLSCDDETLPEDDFPEHPYTGNKKRYIAAAKEKIEQFLDRYSNDENANKKSHMKDIINNCKVGNLDNLKQDEKSHLHLHDKNETTVKDEGNQCVNQNGDSKEEAKLDTFVIPLIQMYPLGIIDDELATSSLFRFSPSEAKIFIATAYFNLTSKYWNHILKSSCNDVDLVMAHPEANGFFQAPGMAGGIPHAYTLIARQCYRDVVKFKQQDRIRFWEYLRPGWTFHGKGMWAQIGNSLVPCITMIGSSNFGNRSVYRDLEAQALIITTNDSFSHQLVKEKDNLMDFSLSVNSNTYREENRKTPFWVFLIRTFMKTFF